MHDHFACFVCLAAMHVLALYPSSFVSDPARRQTTRWFAVHAMANAVISALVVPSIIAVAMSPTLAAYPPAHSGAASSSFPVCLVLWLHVYHSVFYTMSAADMLHHGVFVPLLFIRLLASYGVFYRLRFNVPKDKTPCIALFVFFNAASQMNHDFTIF